MSLLQRNMKATMRANVLPASKMTIYESGETEEVTVFQSKNFIRLTTPNGLKDTRFD